MYIFLTPIFDIVKSFPGRPEFTLVDAPVQRGGGCPKTSNYPLSKMKPTLVSTNDQLLVLVYRIFEKKKLEKFCILHTFQLVRFHELVGKCAILGYLV